VQSIFLVRLVKFGIIILQNTPSKLTHSSEKQGAKTCFLPLFWSHAFYFYVEFEQKTCILHHFAFLFARQFTKIHRPKNSFL
jgi:hypothetical protein